MIRAFLCWIDNYSAQSFEPGDALKRVAYSFRFVKFLFWLKMSSFFIQKRVARSF